MEESQSTMRMLLLCALIGCCGVQGAASAQRLRAAVGSEVTLSCTYDVKFSSPLNLWWRSNVRPNRGGIYQLTQMNEDVIIKVYGRHEVRGDWRKGLASLTIRALRETDSGTYWCHVEMPSQAYKQETQVTLAVVPVRPNSVSVWTKEVTERTWTVNWAPGFDGGRPVTHCSLEFKEEQLSWAAANRTEVSNPRRTELTLLNLQPAKTYNLRMFVANRVGRSDASEVLTVTTRGAAPTTNSPAVPTTGQEDGPTRGPAVPPDPPMLELKEVTGGTISLAWTPAFEGHGPITGYHLEFKTSGALWDNTKMVVDFGANQTEATLIEMNPATYNVRMFAQNSAGTSKASNVLTVTTEDADVEQETFGTTVSTDTQEEEEEEEKEKEKEEEEDAAMSAGASHSELLAVVTVPVVLVVLMVVAALAAWKLKRMRRERHNVRWQTSAFVRFGNAESQDDV